MGNKKNLLSENELMIIHMTHSNKFSNIHISQSTRAHKLAFNVIPTLSQKIIAKLGKCA